MQKLVFINGSGNEIDLTSGNFGITNWAGLSNVPLNIQTQQVPFEDGGVYLDALMNQREISVTVAIYDGNNLELRYQKKRELISALNPKLGEGTLIYTNDYLSRQIKALPQIPLFVNKNSNDAGTLKASVSFTCCSPYWEDLEKKEITFKIGEQPIIKNEGDVPCQIEMDWFTTFAENAKVTNITQNQEIQIDGELTKNLIITTELGKKSVYSNELKFNNISNTSEGFLSIAYNPNIDLYVCVGGSGIILTSSDGINWNSQIIENMKFVVYILELNIFILVGYNGKILTSTNGTTWTEQDSGTTEPLYSVTYSSELNLLVVGGERGGIYTSQDGINWTSRTSGTQNGIYSIVYSEKINLFVAVGAEGIILTSSDGINWNSQIIESRFYFDSIVWSQEKELFVAVGYPDVIATSQDGINWNSQGANVTYIRSVTYSSELDLFVAVGDNILTSQDGITWSVLDVNIPTNRQLQQIIYNNGKGLFIGIGNNGIVINSYNGEDWKIITVLSGSITDITYCPKYNLFVANNGLISSDGIIWGESENIIPTNSIVWSQEKELFVAVGYNGKIYTSEDAFNWTERTGVTNGYLESVTYSSELDLFVAVGQQGIMITSSDGINWSIQETEFINNFSDIIYCNELNLFIVSGGDIILTSSDGINWTGHIINGDIKSVIYAKNFGLVAVGTNFIATSNNAIDWKIKTTNVSGVKISYSERQNLFVMISYNSYEVFTSYNLIDWHSENIGVSILECVFYSEKDDCFIIGGNNGLITHSEFLKKENMIQNLSSDSNMNMNLQVGDNQFRINNDKGSVVVRIKYRQKYIGV